MYFIHSQENVLSIDAIKGKNLLRSYALKISKQLYSITYYNKDMINMGKLVSKILSLHDKRGGGEERSQYQFYEQFRIFFFCFRFFSQFRASTILVSYCYFNLVPYFYKMNLAMWQNKHKREVILPKLNELSLEIKNYTFHQCYVDQKVLQAETKNLHYYFNFRSYQHVELC